MGRKACTESQCLYKDAPTYYKKKVRFVRLYNFLYYFTCFSYICYCSSTLNYMEYIFSKYIYYRVAYIGPKQNHLSWDCVGQRGPSNLLDIKICYSRF